MAKIICDYCENVRVARVIAKCSDAFSGSVAGLETADGDYVPTDWGIGGDDYIDFSYCFDCGKIQGDFPIAQTELESSQEDEIVDYGEMFIDDVES